MRRARVRLVRFAMHDSRGGDVMSARPVSRRDFLRLSALLAGGVTLLAACSQPSTPAPTAKPAEPAKPAEAAKPADAAKPAAASGKPVSPLAASGGLKETTLTIIIFSGPEADTHTRLAPKF